jgi:hypothetical protein
VALLRMMREEGLSPEPLSFYTAALEGWQGGAGRKPQQLACAILQSVAHGGLPPESDLRVWNLLVRTALLRSRPRPSVQRRGGEGGHRQPSLPGGRPSGRGAPLGPSGRWAGVRAGGGQEGGGGARGGGGQEGGGGAEVGREAEGLREVREEAGQLVEAGRVVEAGEAAEAGQVVEAGEAAEAAEEEDVEALLDAAYRVAIDSGSLRPLTLPLTPNP